MEDTKRLTFSELKVGIFVIIGTSILVVAILTIGSQVGLLESTFFAKTFLNNVSGLKPGDIVLLGGVEVGNVVDVYISETDEMPETEENRTQLTHIDRLAAQVADEEQVVTRLQQRLDQARADLRSAQEQTEPTRAISDLRQTVAQLEQQMESESRDLRRLRERLDRAWAQLQNIAVKLEIRSEHRDWIRRDSHISLGSVGLLGDKYIEISLGRSAEGPAVETEMVEGFLWDAERPVVLITGRPQAGFAELITGANDIVTNFGNIELALEDLLARFSEGEGTVGRFFVEDDFYRNLNAAVQGARATVVTANNLLKETREGGGTFSKLIQDSGIHDQISDSVGRLQRIIGEIEAGQGGIGKFIKDPSLYDQTREVMASVNEFTRRIENGQGTLGKLSTDEALHQKLDETFSLVNQVVDDVEQGEGTLGRLAKDEQLYRNLNQASSELVKLIYDFRQNPKKFLTINFRLF